MMRGLPVCVVMRPNVPASRFVAGFYSSPAFILPVVLFLLFPFSFAYVVVKHRVMEIPVLLKRSARYLLVQRGFVVFIFLLSVGVTIAFINLYSRFVRPNSESALPAGIAVGVGFGMLLAWVGAQAERRVTERIDRAFFRSAYDARQILEDLAAKARTTARPPVGPVRPIRYTRPPPRVLKRSVAPCADVCV